MNTTRSAVADANTTSPRYGAEGNADKTNRSFPMLTPTPVNHGRDAQGVTEPALFATVDGALRFAYGMEARDTVKVSSLFRQMRGSTVRGKGKFDSQWDAHAQAAMILAAVERYTNPQQLVTVNTFYTVPATPMLEMRKQTGYRLLAELIREVHTDAHHWYLVDVIREWAGDRRHHNDAWWARHLGVHHSKLSRITMGRPDRGNTGAIALLNDLNGQAGNRLYAPLTEKGVVE